MKRRAETQDGPVPRQHQPLTLTAVERKSHSGTWSETTYTPRGAPVRDWMEFASLVQPRFEAAMRARLVAGPFRVIAACAVQMDHGADEVSREHWLSSANKALNTAPLVTRESQIAEVAAAAVAKLGERLEAYEGQGSGWTLNHVASATLKLAGYKAFAGRAWLGELPSWIQNKKSVVNVHNNDERCFGYAILAALHADTIKQHRNRPATYSHLFDTLKWPAWPVELDAIEGFEQENKIGVNVWALDLDTATGPRDLVPEHKASHTAKEPVNLLRVYRGESSHFCWVPNMNGLLRVGDVAVYSCSRCWQRFSAQSVLDSHAAAGRCTASDATMSVQRVLPPAPQALVRFKAIGAKLRQPFAVYLDITTSDEANSDGDRIVRATACTAKIVTDFPALVQPRTFSASGDDCLETFLRWLKAVDTRCLHVAQKSNMPLVLTSAQQAEFLAATHCHICSKELKPPPDRHRDHCHISGAYRGPAHPGCNLNYGHQRYQLPVFLHGLKVNAHLLLQAAAKFDRAPKLLQASSETVLSFSWGPSRFVDTRRFLDAPLAELAAQINGLADQEPIRQLRGVFEAFRARALADIKLDPACFLGAPGLAWAACLHETRAELGCFAAGQDDMLAFVERAVRGGVAVIPTRHARANNALVGVDATKPTSWLQLLDANSLYPAAMLQKLPVRDFAWAEDVDEARILAWRPEDDIGFFVEADVDYPVALHAATQLPLLPEHRAVDPSPRMAALRDRRSLAVSGAPKLVATLHDKRGIVCHVAELQQALRSGLKLVRVAKALQFKQAAALQPWIDLCVAKRQASTTAFDKGFWKLMMNSCFGKTLERVHERPAVELLPPSMPADTVVRRLSRSTFKDATLLEGGMLLVEQARPAVDYAVPIAVGASILGIAKTLLQGEWQALQAEYGERVQLCLSDTDSLLVHIKTPDLHADMAARLDRYDTSNFARDNPLYSSERAKIPGFFKDEHPSGIVEFCGLRPKMYSILTRSSEVVKAGGVIASAAASIKHAAFKACLFDGDSEHIEHEQTRARGGVCTTATVSRTGLCEYDDTVHVCADGVTTRPHGYRD